MVILIIIHTMYTPQQSAHTVYQANLWELPITIIGGKDIGWVQFGNFWVLSTVNTYHI